MSDSKPYRDGPISYTPTAADIMQLRQQSGMPVTMCRDALAAEDGHQGRAAEWLRVESAKRWPDGGPHRHDIDWLPEKPSNVELVEADIPAIDDLTFTAHRWLPREPIPYDEMRRLCGLPDIPDLRAAAFFGDAPSNPWTIFRSPGDPFITWTNPFLPNAAMTRRQATLRLIAERLRELGVLPQWSLPDDPIDPSAWTVQVDEPEPETPQQRALPRPSTTPPPWADNPAGQRRPTKTRNHRRVK